MPMMKRFTTAFAMLALAALPVAGQQMQMGPAGQKGGMMGQDMMQMCHAMMGEGGGMGGHAMMGGSDAMMGGGGMKGMMQGMGPSPAAVLGAAERLELTLEQQSLLGSLAETTREAHQDHMQAVMVAHQKAAEALKTDAPDLDAYERSLQEAAGHMVQAHVAMTRGSLSAQAVLTQEQRAELKDGMALMGSMMCGMMGEGAMMNGQPGEDGGHAQHHR
jgi:hypothetical protein